MAIAAAASPAALAQTANTRLTIHVNTVAGDNPAGQPVDVTQTDWNVSYGNITLDADGNCSLKVYPGNHRLTIDRVGFNQIVEEFTISDTDETFAVEVSLEEKTRTPFALTASHYHDAYSGRDDVSLGWNVEEPAFFDDFESYEPFSITFGDWTGIDGDLEAAAPLVGSYPNRGVMQYAQIINPLTVVPTWWYDYAVLRPYSGQQYVGFTRTGSGMANDDWLISPTVTVGVDNILSFMAKAADVYNERFMVYVTDRIDNPQKEDFTRLDEGNFETVDYRGWRKFSYDLSEFAGKKIRFAIRYISDTNRYGAFMLMVDDVYVGQKTEEAAVKARRAAMKSPANPYEKFNIYLDGVLSGTTDGYSWLAENVAPGKHTFGIEAVYRAGKSEIKTLDVEIPAGPYAKVDFELTANSALTPDRIDFSLLNSETAETYALHTESGAASIASLPHGRYTIHSEEGIYEAHTSEFEVTGDRKVEVTLEDNVIEPYNITATSDEGKTTFRWNQILGFSDSFEEYEDFATGEFGEWKTIDGDGLPVYPIGLGSQQNIVSFPGSGNATNPTPLAPMVFNPWKTIPAMLPTDMAIAAPTGDKSIIFFSPQRAGADKWLISPLVDIRDAYEVAFSAKAYTIYPESLEICISEGSDNPADFEVLAAVPELPSSQWTRYSVDLSAYAGRKVRIAIHYTSFDAFLAQVDDFTVGPADGEGETEAYGNIVKFEVSLDGKVIGETEEPVLVIDTPEPGEHKVGICAVYRDRRSAVAEYIFGVSSAADIMAEGAEPAAIYDMLGRKSGASANGVKIILKGNKAIKTVK